jgi:hypothetical protein
MSKNKNIKLILSTLGMLSAAFSIVMLLTTTVLAGCTASATACPDLTCSLKGAGTCYSSTYCIRCRGEGQPEPILTCCLP